jgi:hypothetical protein
LIVTTVFVGIISGIIAGVSGKPPRDMATVPRLEETVFFCRRKLRGVELEL